MPHVPGTELNYLTCIISFQYNKPERFSIPLLGIEKLFVQS